MTTAPALSRETGDVLIIGGGAFGAALARHALPRADRVVVASRTPRPHAALWRSVEALTPPRGLVARGARVFIAVSPGARDDAASLYGTALPRLVGLAWREGAASVTVIGPAGAGHPLCDAFAGAVPRLPDAGRAAIVRVSALFGPEDGCLAPLIRSLREHGVARVPADVPPAWALFVDDAVRAVWQAPPGDRALRGETRVHLEEAVDRAVARFGGRRARRWFGGRDRAALLTAQISLSDEWSDADGPRLSVADWISRLPGLRRKR